MKLHFVLIVNLKLFWRLQTDCVYMQNVIGIQCLVLARDTVKKIERTYKTLLLNYTIITGS